MCLNVLEGSTLGVRVQVVRLKSLGRQLVSDLTRQLGGHLRVGPGPEALFEVTFAPTPK